MHGKCSTSIVRGRAAIGDNEKAVKLSSGHLEGTVWRELLPPLLLDRVAVPVRVSEEARDQSAADNRDEAEGEEAGAPPAP
jgi:hypothetical protein